MFASEEKYVLTRFGSIRSFAFGLLLIASGPFVLPAHADPEHGIDFNRDVKPILAQHCYLCHGPDHTTRKGELRLDVRESATTKRPGFGAAAIRPEEATKSLLIRLVKRQDEYRMPPIDRPRLSAQEIATLTEWIDQGAIYDTHWAWKTLNKNDTPHVDNTLWPTNDVDSWILKGLESSGLSPAPPADKAMLMRRAMFAVIGLPPTPQQIDSFVSNADPNAYNRLVDELLDSPAYGEKWSRHWLDLMRYAESYGHEFDYPISYAWRYRDYLIRTLNDDLPYDQIVREHIAGDLVSDPRLHPQRRTNESVLATGAWYLGQAVHAPVDVRLDQAERYDDQIDTMTKAFLGVTISCARCHDHKFDPFLTKDYYALAGFLRSSRENLAYLDPNATIQETILEIMSVHDHVNSTIDTSTQILPDTDPDDQSNDIVDIVIADFDTTEPKWYESGHAFVGNPHPIGHWSGRREGSPRVDRTMVDSGVLSSKLEGRFSSPTFELALPFVNYRVRGNGGQVRLIIDGYRMDIHNPLLFEGVSQKVSVPEEDGWTTISQDVTRHLGHHAHIELIDDAPDGFLAVDRIWLSETNPADDQNMTTAAITFTEDFDDSEISESWAEISKLVESLPRPLRAMTMQDGSPMDEYIFVRGDHRDNGGAAPRSFIQALGGKPIKSTGSGRLDLADDMFSHASHLIARVYVNRVWHHLFGQGLVRTTSDFGAMGESPSHPELLDVLAIDFMKDWSIKRLIRKIMLSKTYQMAAIEHDPRARDVDPDNRLLHHFPLHRLDAESIRDAVLAISGQLDTTMYGPPVPTHLTSFMTGRGRPGKSGPLDGEGRRSIYLAVLRNFLPPSMLSFDVPNACTSVGRRGNSNVPAQALALMNGPFLREQADRWGEAIVRSMPDSRQDRVQTMYLQAYARPPKKQELDLAMSFVAEVATNQEVDLDTDPVPWATLGHALLNTKEFLFIQ
ncbi:MAG: PSD1 and planctomycete cytochrome C domain-containing protein [Phycisphaerales bacterium]|nr:PSD1 and planctomycete cytochrome C domain-containing protein [Phycisphaerales bacterium]